MLIDDVFGALDDEGLEHVADMFAHELARTSLIHIGKAAQAHHPIFSRVLHLIKAPGKVPRSRGQAGQAAAGRDYKRNNDRLAVKATVEMLLWSGRCWRWLRCGPAAQELEFHPPAERRRCRPAGGDAGSGPAHPACLSGK